MKRLKKRLLPLLAVFLLAGLLRGGAHATGSVEDMVAQAKRGVVQLYTVEYQNDKPTGHGCKGTGFAVGTAGEDSDIFVTNWHVVTASGEYDPYEVKVYIALDDSSFNDACLETEKVVPCEVLYISPAGNPDFAILRATEPVSGFKALPLLSSDKIRDAAHVVALGYPGLLDDVSATSGGMNDMSVTQGTIVRHTVGAEGLSFSGTKLLIFDATISHGNSGGALVNDAGAVVGINTYGFSEGATEFSAAVYVDYAMEALDGLGIPYDVYDPATADGGSTTASGTEPVEEKTSLSPVLLVGAGAAVVALAAVVVVLLRKPAAAGAGQAAAQKKGPDTGFALLGPGGQRTPVTASGLVIGRDPGQCSLCLPQETKGVSRRHCQVTVNGGLLLLTDLGSSYGTFAAGQKLEPNRPVSLTRGSSFYLSDPSVTFTVQ